MAPTARAPKDPPQDSGMEIDSDQPQKKDVQKFPPNQDVSQPHASANERITEQQFLKRGGSMTKDADCADTEHPAPFNLPVRPKLKDVETSSRDVQGFADAKQEGCNIYDDAMDVYSSTTTTSQEHTSNSQCPGTLFSLPDRTVAASLSTSKRKRSALSAVEDKNEDISAGEDKDESDSDDEEPEAKKVQAERLGGRLARRVTSGYDMLPDSLKDSGLGRKLSTLDEVNKEEGERLIAVQAKLVLEAKA